MMYLAIIFVVLVVVLFVEDYYAKKLSEKYTSRKMPGLPVIGSSYLFFSQNILDVFSKYSRQFMKNPFYFRLFFQDIYCTCIAEEIKEVLTSPKTVEKGAVYRLFQWMIPDSLLIVKDAVWRKKRRCLAKLFNQRKLNAMVPFLNKNTEKLVEKIRTDNGENLLELIQNNIIDGFMEGMIGFHAEDMNEEIRLLYSQIDVCKGVKALGDNTVKRMFKPWLYYDFFFFCTKEGKELLEITAVYSKILKHLVEIRKETAKAHKNEYVNDEDKDLIDVMIDGNFEEKDIMVESQLFAGAAMETTGIALSITFTLLGMYPDIQEKVYREVMGVTGGRDTLDHKDLVKLSYTEMVLNEAMRIFPPIPFILRLVSSDLSLDGKIIPKKTNILINIFELHRSEKYWKNPMKFDPDRFLLEEIEKRPPFSFLPFSGGPRNCIGAKFSIISMKIIMANIIREFHLSSTTKCIEDIKIDSQVIAKIEKGVDCTFTPRIKV